MRDETQDKIHVEQNFKDDKDNQWCIKVTEDDKRRFRLHAKCNDQAIGRPLYFAGRGSCFEYLDKLLKNKNLKEI